MGGGGSKSDKAEQDRLERERASRAITTDTAIAKAEAPSALEQFLGDEDLEVLKYWGGKSGEPVDVRRSPGMMAPNALYDDAIKDRGEERMGIGALRMGSNEDAGYTNLLKENLRDRNQQAAAGRLEGAVGQKIAQARGEAMPLINISNERDMGIAGLRSGMYESAADRSQQFRMRPKPQSFWKQMLLQGMQTGGQMASAKMAVACVVLDTPILTPTGYQPIGELIVGDLVIGINKDGQRGEFEIVRKRVTDDVEVNRITDTNGNVLEASSTHRLMKAPNDHSERTVAEMSNGEVLGDTTIKTIEPSGRKTVVLIKIGNQIENFGFFSPGFMHLDDYKIMEAHQ